MWELPVLRYCESEPVIDAKYSAVVAQLALACLKMALIVRTVLLTYGTLATHDSHSLKKMMTTACTLIIFVIQRDRLKSVDMVPHRNMVVWHT